MTLTPVPCKVCEEGCDLRLTHVPGMSLIVEENESTDPLQVGGLGPEGEMSSPYLIAKLI